MHETSGRAIRVQIYAARQILHASERECLSRAKLFERFTDRPALGGPGGNVSLELAVMPAWPAEPVGG